MQTTLARETAGETALQQTAPLDFDGIMRQHQRRIYRILLLLVRNPDDADTLTQDCFLHAFLGMDRFRGDACIETWLVRIAINLARDHAKNRRMTFWRRLVRARQETHLEPEGQGRSPEYLLLAREKTETVWASADGLPVQQRTAFLLRFGEEMSLAEVAQAMGLELGTVKSHLSRAVEAVKRNLQKRGTLYPSPKKAGK